MKDKKMKGSREKRKGKIEKGREGKRSREKAKEGWSRGGERACVLSVGQDWFMYDRPD